MMTPHHCRMCGRTCCYYCSLKRQLNESNLIEISADNSLDLSVSQISDNITGPNVRICTYCDLKLNNPQIDKFYEHGKTWQKRENDIVEQKLNWYQHSILELNKQINEEQESMILSEMNNASEKTQMSQKIDHLLSDKLRIAQLKKNVENDLAGQTLTNQALESEIEDLHQKSTMMMLELDKVMSMYDDAEQEKADLIQKIQVMQGLYNDQYEKGE